MLNYDQKIKFLSDYLCLKSDSYGDKMKDEIYSYYFDLENEIAFLDDINTEEEIKQKVDLTVSKMILHEHEDGLESIIQQYL